MQLRKERPEAVHSLGAFGIILESVALHIRGVEDLVRLMAARRAAHPLVALVDDRVQVALAERLSLVLIIERLCTERLDVRKAADRRRLDRLAAAVDAAARAAHDFHNVVIPRPSQSLRAARSHC